MDRSAHRRRLRTFVAPLVAIVVVVSACSSVPEPPSRIESQATTAALPTVAPFAITPFDRKLQIHDELHTRAEEYASAQREYGGTYIDPGRALVFTFTGDLERHRAALDAILSPHLPFRVRAVRFTLRELDRAQDEIDALWPRLERQGIAIVSTAPDTEANRVVVGVARLTPAIERELRRRFGEIIKVEDESPPPAPTQVPGTTRILPGKGSRVLAEGRHRHDDQLIQVATTDADFERYWKDLFPRRAAPDVAFGRQVVIFYHLMVGAGCPLVFEAVEVDPRERLVYSGFHDAYCSDVAVPHTFVVAVERDPLPRGRVRFRLEREFLCEECGTEGQEVEVKL